MHQSIDLTCFNTSVLERQFTSANSQVTVVEPPFLTRELVKVATFADHEIETTSLDTKYPLEPLWRNVLAIARHVRTEHLHHGLIVDHRRGDERTST